MSYFYAITESVRNIPNLSLIYEKYLNSNKITKDNSNKLTEISIKNTRQTKVNPTTGEIQTKKVVIQTVESFAARRSSQEKVIKLCESFENVSESSSLVKYALINELFQVLYNRYDNLDNHRIIVKKQKYLIRSLKQLRLVATQKQDKKLISTINECLALIGYVDQTSVKHRGINILSLDGGGLFNSCKAFSDYYLRISKCSKSSLSFSISS